MSSLEEEGAAAVVAPTVFVEDVVVAMAASVAAVSGGALANMKAKNCRVDEFRYRGNWRVERQQRGEERRREGKEERAGYF